MAKISDNELNAVTRRIVTVYNHFLLPIGSGSNSGLTRGSIGLCNASMDDSYHRIHGEVASHEVEWKTACDEYGKEFTDIIYEKAIGEGIAKITINRPERRNAFRPQTIKELIRAFNDARDDSSIGVIILTGKGTKAFCSGGDQALRKADGYADFENFGRLNVLDLQVQIRRLPKPVIAMVAGYAVGGGHVLHMLCCSCSFHLWMVVLMLHACAFVALIRIIWLDMPQVGSFDAGYGSSIMSRLVSYEKDGSFYLA
uniref:1,4-dihydroxy-2-naphthoyl-CoA synthase n=1 Tax=Gossypium raimondii TaxID=29730 RepID=A0A0D2SIS4_GOSRA|nr:hypothetical protein B456_005G181500 [Gossypium raimondii]